MKKRYEHDIYVDGELKTTLFSFDPDPTKLNHKYKSKYKPHFVETHEIDNDDLYRNGPRIRELETTLNLLSVRLDEALGEVKELKKDFSALDRQFEKAKDCAEEVREDLTAISKYTEENRDRIIALEP